MTAALAVFDVAPEDCRAADLDGRHHLQLREAYVTSVLGAPSGAVTLEDVRDLYRRAHAGSTVRAPAFHQQGELLERAGHRPDRPCRNAGIECGVVELGMAEQPRVIIRILLRH
jgi:hypothetical protein